MVTASMHRSSNASEHLRCVRSYGQRRFWSRQRRVRYLPPLLWTVPGAGNTWVRLLLDHSTGIYSGSIYGDSSLLPLLPGEGRCDRSVIAVKAHPPHIDSSDILPTRSGAFRLNVSRKPQYVKCASLRFDAAIIVVRDPYRSIWAEYKRYVNWKEVVAGQAPASPSGACREALRAQPLHSGGLLKTCFNESHFHHHAQHLARAWKHTWFHYNRFRAMPNARLLQLTYEELLEPRRRAAVLRSVLEFLGLGWRLSDDAIACASALAEHPYTHRDHRTEQGGPHMSILDAYANRSLVCLMWHMFKRKAAKAGYAPFNRARC